MGRKTHYHDLHELMDDLDHESFITDELDTLGEDDLELLHQVNPDSPKFVAVKPQKKRGRKPKPKA